MLKNIYDHWRAIAAITYLLICAFDFIVFPSYIGVKRVDMMELIQQIEKVPEEQRRLVIEIAYRPHQAFTLQGGGLFHLAFGAILTGAAVTGKNKE